MTNKVLTVPALKCKQNKFEFFVFVLTAEQLVEISYVSTREREGDQGYQRLLDKKRAEAIKRHIEVGGTLPNNIILNFNDPHNISYNENDKKITISYEHRSAWIIDGQHRLYGADLLSNMVQTNELARSYQFLVSAFKGLEIVQQARIFVDINSHQKGVSRSLIYDLMNLFEVDDDTQEEFYISRASDIVRMLNDDPESPFYERISRTKERVRGTISQVTFIDALKPHLVKGGVFSQAGKFQLTLEDQYKIIKNFFNAVRNNLPDLWFNDKAILTKTTGFNALMLSLPTIFVQTEKNFDGFRLDDVQKVLTPLKGLPWSGKDIKGQQGKVAAKTLAETIQAAVVSNLEKINEEQPKKRLKL